LQDAQRNLEQLEHVSPESAARILTQRWKQGFDLVEDTIRELDSAATRSEEELDLVQLKFFEYVMFLSHLFRGRLPGDYFHNVLEHGAAVMRDIGSLGLLDQQAEEASQPVHRRIAVRATTRLGGHAERRVECHRAVMQHFWTAILLSIVCFIEVMLSKVSEQRIVSTIVIKHRKKQLRLTVEQQQWLRNFYNNAMQKAKDFVADIEDRDFVLSDVDGDDDDHFSSEDIEEMVC